LVHSATAKNLTEMLEVTLGWIYGCYIDVRGRVREFLVEKCLVNVRLALYK
jgi:hypothetical protein